MPRLDLVGRCQVTCGTQSWIIRVGGVAAVHAIVHEVKHVVWVKGFTPSGDSVMPLGSMFRRWAKSPEGTGPPGTYANILRQLFPIITYL